MSLKSFCSATRLYFILFLQTHVHKFSESRPKNAAAIMTGILSEGLETIFQL